VLGLHESIADVACRGLLWLLVVQAFAADAAAGMESQVCESGGRDGCYLRYPIDVPDCRFMFMLNHLH
jgi:hypothetical protein